MTKDLLLAAWLLGPAARAPEQVPAPPSGLEVQIAVKLDPGPPPGALDAFERQTGVAFSVLPELPPPGLKTPALSHRGTVSGGRAQESPRPPALDARVSFKVDAGPLLAALEAVERQTGVAFSVLPELLPPDLKIPALSHDGPLAGGLDKIAGPLKLRWCVGDFGGIVVLPQVLKIPSFEDWVAAHFADRAGVELLEVGEQGQRLGLRNGDILIALNGERKWGFDGFWTALHSDTKPGEEVTFTVRRGPETLQVKAAIGDKGRWLTRGLGVARHADSPALWGRYEKGVAILG